MPPSSSLSDASTRRRIGPWHPDRLPSLNDFEPDTNFVVRAAAGSGKTTALVARIVALVRSGVPIDACTAITFTRKAASEMKARLYEELRTTDARLRKADAASAERKNVRRALQNLPRCFVGTIHSFCARLLRERPLDADLPPDFTAGIEDREREDLRHQAWQSYLSDVWEASPDRIDHIAALGLEPADLVHFFGELCRYPDLAPHVDGPDHPPDLDATVDALRRFVETWSEELPSDPADGDAKPGTAATALRTAQRFLEYRTLDDPATKAEFVALFEDLTKTDRRKSTEMEIRGDLTKGHWLNAEAAERLDNEVLPTLVQEVVEPALRAWKAYVHRHLVQFTRPAVERYAEHRRETGQLTFQDLLVQTRTLLKTNPSARRALQREYPRLLVDEFQDTDPLQAEILFYLASQDPTESHWRQCRPRDGSLFIVGDDKQSIYRFRRADLDVYRTVRKTIDQAPNGEDVTLQSNFRSVPPLLDWCNDTFSTLFDDLPSPYQAPYVAFDPARTEVPSEPTVRQLKVPYVKGSSSTRDIARRNAEQVATYIASARSDDDPLLRDEEGAPLVKGTPGDFMILTRTRSRLDVFAEALAEHGLPYTLTGGDDAKNSTEVRALLTLLTCVERPLDPVARIAYLRGPLVGFSDDALYRFHASGGSFDGPFELDPMVGDGLSDDTASRLQTAYEHLRRAGEWLEHLRPAAAIERIVDRLGLMPRTRRSRRRSGLGSLRAGRLLRILHEVQRLDAEGHPWTAIRDELQQVLDGDRELDGHTLDTGTDDAVRLLNVHKAKGLEAPVVILADPYGGKHPKAPDEHVRRDEGEVVLPVYEEHRFNRSLRYAPERWTTEFQDTEARYQQAEEQRLLYVAATRAQSLLVVSRYRSDRWSEDKGYWAPLYPFLDDCPSLEVPEEAPPPPTPSHPPTTAPDLDRRRERVAHPTYRTRTVTEPEGPQALPSQPGYGSDFGIAMHELLAELVHRRSTLPDSGLPEALVESILEEHDVLELRSTAQQMLRTFRSGPLWADLITADVVHTEFPVAQMQEPDDDQPELVDGTVDLLYHTASGWHLVDYKTDRLPEEDFRLVETYRPQLETYAQMWEAATGQELETKGLWLGDTGSLVPL